MNSASECGVDPRICTRRYARSDNDLEQELQCHLESPAEDVGRQVRPNGDPFTVSASFMAAARMTT